MAVVFGRGVQVVAGGGQESLKGGSRARQLFIATYSSGIGICAKCAEHRVAGGIREG